MAFLFEYLLHIFFFVQRSLEIQIPMLYYFQQVQQAIICLWVDVPIFPTIYLLVVSFFDLDDKDSICPLPSSFFASIFFLNKVYIYTSEACSHLFHKPAMVKYITGHELAAIIKSDQVPLKDYLVVDVRDDDYLGGHIVKGQNWPSHNFMWKVDELVEKTKNVKVVIFHCAFSQERGPKAARIYENKLQAQGTDNLHEVLVLRGGFSKFQAKFKDDATLVENWDKNVWASGWS